MVVVRLLSAYAQRIGYSAATPQGKRTFWGTILMKLGTGVLGAWGVISIYYFSYYKQTNDIELKMSEFNLVVTLAAIPACIFAIFAARIGRRFGFANFVRVGMILSPMSMILASFQSSFLNFALLSSLVAGVCFGSTLMPILYCLWSHFPSKTGNVTGIVLASFGIATFFYSIIATLFVNPHNETAYIPYKEKQQVRKSMAVQLMMFKSKQIYHLFGEDVIKNVPSMALLLGCLQGIFCIPGAFLIQEADLTQNSNTQELLLINNQPSTDYVEITAEQNDIQITSKMQDCAEVINCQLNEQKNYNSNVLNYQQAILSEPFVIIFFSSFLLTCFQVFISLCYKTYGLIKINDDHFLTYNSTICTIIGSLSNLIWGHFVDKYAFKTIYQMILISVLVAGFLFPYLATSKLGFFISFLTLSACERGLYTIIGPGLVQIFGIRLGAELLPIKTISYFLALMVLPIILMIFLQSHSFDETTHLILIAVLLALLLSLKLKSKYPFSK